MRNSTFKNPGKPLARKTPLKSHKPMNRGTARLVATKPMARSTKPMAAVGQRARRTGQGKVAPTAAEQAWMDKAREFGCIVCYLQHGARTPAAIHHILSGGRRMGHMFTLPLCDPGHHQNSPTPAKISRHPYKTRFEAAYGSELALLDTLKNLLANRYHIKLNRCK
jgi:hypothetical protein